MTDMASPITVVVLAAGTASRFGATKQLADVAGVPMIRRVVDTAVAADVGTVVVVVGHDAEAVLAVLPAEVTTVENPRHAEGQSTSLACGLDAAESLGSHAAVILLGDEPGVSIEAVRLVAGADHEAPIVRAVHDDHVPGHPVRLDASIWPRLRGLDGDVGAKALDDIPVAHVPVPGARPRDVDRPQDLSDQGFPHR